MADCNCGDRRSFLKLGGLGLVVSAINPRFIAAARDRRLEPLRELRGRAPHKTFIHIWLRGGQDGLNACIPTDPTQHGLYLGHRPGIGFSLASLAATQLPGLPVGDTYALHPSMGSFVDLWNRGMLAVLPTVGYEDSSRSHFDSQQFIEVGVPFNKVSPDGWLNRWLQTSPGTDPLRAVSFTSGIPFELVGNAPVMSFTDINSLSVSPPIDSPRNIKYTSTMGTVYGLPTAGRRYDQEVADAGLGMVSAMNNLRNVMPLPAPHVTYPAGTFGTNLMQLSQLIRAKLAGSPAFDIEVANVELGGWDTHTQQANGFANLVTQLSDGLQAFVDDLTTEDPALMDQTVILTVSEFGRTTMQNGNAGTDHGNAWLSFAIGTNINQGVYNGPTGWPGLDPAQLREGRDLEYTTDFRDVYAEVLQRHMGSLDAAVFPGYTPNPVGFL